MPSLVDGGGPPSAAKRQKSGHVTQSFDGLTSASHAGANSSRGGTRKRGREDGRAGGDGGGARDPVAERSTAASDAASSTRRQELQRSHQQGSARSLSTRRTRAALRKKATADASADRTQKLRRELQDIETSQKGSSGEQREPREGDGGGVQSAEKENERPDVASTNHATTSASGDALGVVSGGDGRTASAPGGDTPEAERVEGEGRVRERVRDVESERKVASAQLEKQQKLEQKSALDRRLSELKSQNGGMRAELHRAANQLALKHRELLEAQGRSEEGRKKLGEFKSRLERAVGVARLLPGYKARVESLMQQLQEKEARLDSTKGRVLSKLQSAMVRRDDAQHRHESLIKAINANAAEERSIAEDITRIRSEIASDEQDLSAAQQTESESKIRVETIEHEVSAERARHADAVADLESKAKEMVAAKEATARAIEEKKAAMEAKKRQLSEMFAKCNELRKAEGHDTFPEPKWGEEQPPGLDMASVRVRVAAEEKALEAKKAERDVLRKDVAKLDATIASNTAKAVEKRAEAEALMKMAAAAREVEAQRKADTEKMVAEADVECEEVERLRASIGELTATKEAHAEEVKSKLEGEQGTVLNTDAEITTMLAEIAAVEKARRELEERESAEKQALVAKVAEAKRRAANAKEAYEQAQRKADNFAALPDDELAMELQQLDEEEKQIVEEANRKRDEMIDEEPVLEYVNLDWNSDIPIEEQKEAGRAYIRQHCRDILETARAVRQARGLRVGRIPHRGRDLASTVVQQNYFGELERVKPDVFKQIEEDPEYEELRLTYGEVHGSRESLRAAVRNGHESMYMRLICDKCDASDNKLLNSKHQALVDGEQCGGCFCMVTNEHGDSVRFNQRAYCLHCPQSGPFTTWHTCTGTTNTSGQDSYSLLEPRPDVVHTAGKMPGGRSGGAILVMVNKFDSNNVLLPVPAGITAVAADACQYAGNLLDRIRSRPRTEIFQRIPKPFFARKSNGRQGGHRLAEPLRIKGKITFYEAMKDLIVNGGDQSGIVEIGDFRWEGIPVLQASD